MSKSPSLKVRIFQILEVAHKDDRLSRAFDIFIMTMIVLNIVGVILETESGIMARYGTWLRAFDLFSLAVFTVEYILRIWTCNIQPRYKNPVWGRLRFALTPFLMIDFLAIAPFYLPFFIPVDLRILRAVRLARLFRVLKVYRYSDALQTFVHVLRLKKQQLAVSIFILTVILLFASAGMYFIEHEAQPDKFGSIPATMWWSVVTLSTVGYGDVYPITPLGKIFGGVVALIGVGLFAIPAGILASGFTQNAINKLRRQRNYRHR